MVATTGIISSDDLRLIRPIEAFTSLPQGLRAEMTSPGSHAFSPIAFGQVRER